MKECLIQEITAILNYYNASHYNNDNAYDWGSNDQKEITIEDFEEKIDWEWVPKYYCISKAFISEYYDKLDKEYLINNYMIDKKELDIIKKENGPIDSRFDLLDL